ncbi:hypothetical protein OHA59_25365 [Streptomyces sp. NBC_01589]|uniref:hypothetical protein n=1 Tax=Streptomyces sp. NBC_01589 TaxID=2975886 RepID=UPI003868FF70
MSPRPLSSSGEEAIRRISALLEETEDFGAPGGGNQVVAFATIAEAHVDKTIRKLFGDSGVLEAEVSRRLYSEVQDSIHRSWDARYKWLSQAFNVKIAGERFEQDFSLLVELRNSIIHGNGSLTSLQASKVPQMISIRAGLRRCLGLESHGRKFLLNGAIVVPAAKICRDYILGFDARVQERFPGFDV